MVNLQSPCKECSRKCCEKFIVPLTIFDLFRIKKATGKDIEQFSTLIEYNKTDEKNFFPIFFMDQKRNLKQMLLVLKRFNNSCIFFDQQICLIWPAHPLVCKVYPFFEMDKNGELKYVKNFICPRKWTEKEIDNYKIKEALAVFKFEIEEHNKIIRKWNAEYREKSEKDFFEYLKKSVRT
ncbi:MAG: YkgJ family cysteine cluster protein [Candidatus Micrarchaeota archaeon]|nr:YkgJ family cysteine cluster protein [Candidatus Micrarchaeota archaeon]